MLGRPTVSSPAAKRRRVDEADAGGDDSRRVCPYGSRCYRRNPVHLREFTHPAAHSPSTSRDALSSSSAAVAALPACKYGANCYRKNLMHFAEFSHPFDAPVSSDTEEEEEENGAAEDSEEKEETEEEDDGQHSDATDPVASDEEAEEEPNALVKRGLSLVRHYSSMSEEERRALVRQAIEAKCSAERRLEELRERVRDRESELERLRHQFSEAGMLLKGEEEAMRLKDKVTYFPLYASRQYKAGSAAEIHFRLAESQFYRLLTGESLSNFRVTKVEYVVNPRLIGRFRERRAQLARDRGEQLSYPVLAFHGTSEEAIAGICEGGFRVPGEAGFVATTDEGYYGRGVYFSEFPSYSMGYIRGATRLLLCQVVLGKVFRCTNFRHGQPLEDGFDSHASPDKKELIVFASDQILPCYVIHYSMPSAGYRYDLSDAERDAFRARWVAAKKKKASSVFRGLRIMFTGNFTVCSNADLKAIVRKHGGLIGSGADFNVLVATQDVFDSLHATVHAAIERKVPCINIAFVLDSIIEGKKMDVDCYGFS